MLVWSLLTWLSSLLLVGPGACNVHVKDAAVQSYISRLTGVMKMDWNKPPSVDGKSWFEPTAWPLVLICARTEFKERREVARGSDSKRMPNMTVYYTTYVERSVGNTGDDDIEMTSEESTTTVDSTTSGWQVGAQLIGGGSSVAIGISAGYSKSWSAGSYKTKAVTIRTTCKSGYDCRIETWSFHVKVAGDCRVKPLIECGGRELDVCGTGMASYPQQYLDYQARECVARRGGGGGGGGEPYRHEACEVSMPILDQAGKPVTRVVRVSEKFIPDEEEGGEVGGNGDGDGDDGGTARLKAVLKEDGWYQLDNGEWFDPADGLYYGHNQDMWYFKPGPKPDLSSFEAAPPPPPRRSVLQRRGGRMLVEIVFLDDPTF